MRDDTKILKLGIALVVAGIASAIWAARADAQLILNKSVAYQPPIPPAPIEAEKPAKPELPQPLPIYAYSPHFACPACDTAKKWKDLPFRLIWRKSDRFKSYPAFQFPNRRGGYRIVYGADLERLLKDWTLNAETDNDKYRERMGVKTPKTMVVDLSEPELRKVVCGCRGSNPVCCLCLQEIRSGRRSKPCTCNSSKGSVHLVRGQESLKATGEYRTLAQKPVCPNCGRRH